MSQRKDHIIDSQLRFLRWVYNQKVAPKPELCSAEIIAVLHTIKSKSVKNSYCATLLNRVREKYLPEYMKILKENEWVHNK